MSSELEAALVDAFRSHFPAVTCDGDRWGCQEAVDRDDLLLGLALDGRPDLGRLRLWRNGRCVVLPGRQAAEAGASAGAAAKALGFEIAHRRSGGSAVIHRPGILCASLLRVSEVRPGLSEIYEPLLSLVVQVLADLGVAADIGPVDGSYCDGRYNVRIAGRKVAGTAALLRQRGGRFGSLVHACLTVSGDAAGDVAVVRQVERAMGQRRVYREDRHTTVEEHVVRRAPLGAAARDRAAEPTCRSPEREAA